MGVMPCSRRGCENILCSRYSPKYGYICDSCFRELMSTLVDIWYFMSCESLPTGEIDKHQEMVKKEFSVHQF